MAHALAEERTDGVGTLDALEPAHCVAEAGGDRADDDHVPGLGGLIGRETEMVVVVAK